MFFRYSREIFPTNMERDYWILLLKIGLDAAKAASEKVVPKIVEATEDLIRKKIVEKIVKLKPVSDENSRNVEEIVLPPE